MPRGSFIGSFLSRPGTSREDIIIVANPNALPIIIPMRMLLQCDVVRVGQVIFQTLINGHWVSSPNPPPYAVVDTGAYGQPVQNLVIPIIQAVVGGHLLYQINWDHRIHIHITVPNLCFLYQPLARQNIVPPPIRFRLFRMYQQIQTATRAEQILP